MTAAILSGRRTVPPFGMAGGMPGQVGHNTVIRADGHVEEIAATEVTEVGIDDVFVIETPGGGGYGAC
jgi:N-methylhydantoinase B/oxoprolinase/acetone carboxylase alpha subunit